jgi:hypothetical protein
MIDTAALEQLSALKDKGLINQKEFDAKRREILSLRSPRRRWPLGVLLLAFAGGLVFGFGSISATEPTRTAQAADLDASGVVTCSGPAMTNAVAEAARAHQASGRDGKPLEVRLGPVREVFFDAVLRGRGCEADLLIEGRKAGKVSQFAVMNDGGRFTTTRSLSIGSP